jgi:hypothetical protein
MHPALQLETFEQSAISQILPEKPESHLPHMLGEVHP